jgi:hypothetical protein
LGTVSLRLAVPLAIVPFYHLVISITKAQGTGNFLYAAAIVGAGAAAYALGRFRRRPWLDLVLCLGTVFCVRLPSTSATAP